MGKKEVVRFSDGRFFPLTWEERENEETLWGLFPLLEIKVTNEDRFPFFWSWAFKKNQLLLQHSQVLSLQSNQVKGTPPPHRQESMNNEFIIRKLKPLVVVDFRFISAFLNV